LNHSQRNSSIFQKFPPEKSCTLFGHKSQNLPWIIPNICLNSSWTKFWSNIVWICSNIVLHKSKQLWINLAQNPTTFAVYLRPLVYRTCFKNCHVPSCLLQCYKYTVKEVLPVYKFAKKVYLWNLEVIFASMTIGLCRYYLKFLGAIYLYKFVQR